MKNKLKNYLKLGIFLFGITFVLVNCERDEFSSYENIVNKESKIRVKQVNLENLESKDVLQKTLEVISNKLDVNKLKDLSSKDINATDDSFTILTDRILETSTDSTLTYTFMIQTPTIETSAFENFVLVKNIDDSYSYYIYRYATNNEQEDFGYTISSQEVSENQINLEDFDDYISDKLTMVLQGSNGCWYTLEYVEDSSHPLIPTGEWVITGGPDCSGSVGGGGDSTPSGDNTDYNPSPSNNETGGSGGGAGGGNGSTGGTQTSGNTQDSPVAVLLVDNDCDTSADDLKKIFPNLSTTNASTLAYVINNKGTDFGIDTKEKLWHFLSQAGHETGGFNTLQVTENMNYSTASLIPKSYPSKFTMDTVANPTKKFAGNYTSNSSGLANVAMCCKYGNGNEASGDGYKYRGRGIFQLTWKDNYTSFKTWYNNKYDPDKDFVTSPNLISSNDTLAILSGLWYYKTRVLDKITVDSTATVDKVTVKINGKAKKGLKDRKAKFTKAKDSITCK